MPERRDSGEGLHDVLSLPQQLSNCRSIVRAEATSRHARCLPVSRGCRHGEVDSGEARSTTLPPPPSPEPTPWCIDGQAPTRDSHHKRYLPCRWSRFLPGGPSMSEQAGLGENTVSIGQIFPPRPLRFHPPAHTGGVNPVKATPPHFHPIPVTAPQRIPFRGISTPAAPQRIPFRGISTPAAPQRIPFRGISTPAAPQRIPFRGISTPAAPQRIPFRGISTPAAPQRIPFLNNYSCDESLHEVHRTDLYLAVPAEPPSLLIPTP